MTAYSRWAAGTASSSLADSSLPEDLGNAKSRRADAIHPFPAHFQSFCNMHAMSRVESLMRPAVARRAGHSFSEEESAASVVDAREHLEQTGGPP